MREGVKVAAGENFRDSCSERGSESSGRKERLKEGREQIFCSRQSKIDEQDKNATFKNIDTCLYF